MKFSRRGLIAGAAALASGGWGHRGFVIQKNLVTDYGAAIDGVTDISVNWLAFTSFLTSLPAGSTVRLTVPNHTYLFDRGHVIGINLMVGKIGGLKVIVDAPTGAVFTSGADPLASGYFIGALGLQGAVGVASSRIVSVSAGSSAVTLLAPSQNTIYQAGQWICVAGIDLQGFGQPINPAFFEYKQIRAINPTTGVITLTSPLVNQYLSTWPLYSDGSGGGTDLGGPASIFAMHPTWDCDGTYNNITFVQPSQIYTSLRTATYNNCNASGTLGMVPTTSQTVTFNSCIVSGSSVEVDKIVETLTYNYCSAGGSNELIFQSMSCATQCFMNGCNFANLNGTPRNLTITGGTIGAVHAGPSAYGRADSLTINNCNVGNIAPGTYNIGDLVAQGFTISSGVIKVSKAGFGPVPLAIPGSKVFFSRTKYNEDSQFTVSALGDDGSGNTVITTNIPAGFPNIPDPIVGIRPHACPVFNGSGNFGSNDATSSNGAPAQGAQLFSYSLRNYTKANLASDPIYQIWGQLVSINVNVITPYTGVQSTLTATFLDSLAPDHKTVSSYNPTINLKQAGVRTITPTTAVPQAGDTGWTVPGTIWLVGNATGSNIFTPNHDVSGENAGPVLQVEIITDQTVSLFPV